jgi:hypothetical protein
VGLKLVPLPVALLFCALWPRLAPRFVAALAAGVLLPFLTRPAAQVVEQYHGLAEQSRRLSAERWPGFRDLWTAGLVLGRLAEGKTGLPDLKAPLTSRPYRGLQCAGGLAVLVLCWRLGRRRPGGERAALVLGLGTCWLMLLGPSSEPPTYIFLAPALAWGTVQRDRWPAGRGWAIAAALLVLGPGWGGLTRPWWDACPLLLLPLPAGAGCLAVWLVGQAVRSRRDHSACTGWSPSDRIVSSAAESAAAGPPSGGPSGPGSAGPGAKVRDRTGVLSSPSPSANLAGRPGQCPGRI